mmetsp:Transcript_19405/g.25034  ORF Transcript_19405/g.25034 Transcript_19405/m.25034 type:complete len:295 (-) Transcript_19405:112-996(-)
MAASPPMKSKTLLSLFIFQVIWANIIQGFHSLHPPITQRLIITTRSNKLIPSMSTVSKKDSARTFGLAFQLDEGTRKSHSIAENTQFVTGFFKGLSNKKSFSALVASLYFVYEAMESSLDTCQDSRVNALDFNELRRLESLSKDMIYYFGEDWNTSLTPSPATKKYVQHIKDVANSEPILLLAHQYTRYLGDLFGGQMMGGMATRSLKLEDGKGIEFYTFSEIKDTKIFIEEWYTLLNDLDISESEKQQIVDEANLVFRLNIEIFDELEGSGISSAFRLALSTLKASVKKFINP